MSFVLSLNESFKGCPCYTFTTIGVLKMSRGDLGLMVFLIVRPSDLDSLKLYYCFQKALDRTAIALDDLVI